MIPPQNKQSADYLVFPLLKKGGELKTKFV